MQGLKLNHVSKRGHMSQQVEVEVKIKSLFWVDIQSLKHCSVVFDKYLHGHYAFFILSFFMNWGQYERAVPFLFL